MMSSAPARSAGGARNVSQKNLVPRASLGPGNEVEDPFVHCPIESRLQALLGVRSFYVERKDRIGGASDYVKDAN